MKDKYQAIEISILSTYLYKSLILINGINLILSLSKLNAILSIILGAFLGYLILNLYLKINDILPEYNIFNKLDHSYNNFFAPIIKTILIICTFIFTFYLFKVSTSFIKFNYVNNLTIEIINILYIISLIYLVNKNLKTIVKVSTISLSLVILLDILSRTFSIININPSNLLPITLENFSNTIISGIDYIILNTIPLFLLLIIPKNQIDKKHKYNKYMKITYIIISIYIIFNIILLLSIVNINIIKFMPYPNVFILSKINVLNFFDRIENILSYKFMFDSFITLALSIYYIKEGLNSFFQKSKKYLIYIIGALIYIINLFFTLDIKYILLNLVIFLTFNLVIIFNNK